MEIAAPRAPTAGRSHAPRPSPVSAKDLDLALREGRIEVHFQPIVVLRGRQVVGFEALARMRTVEGRLLAPAAFVPVAERSGLVLELGATMLHQAVAGAARWRAGSSLITAATVSVNVAPAQLVGDDLADLVRATLAEHDMPGSVLVLEITESAATSSAARPVLEELSALGVRIALDDFGVGFATLDNLRRLPVHVLKLDRSFVAGVANAGADRAIVRVIVDLADSLGMSVIAEGVETPEQAEALQRLGCPAAQGNFYGRPNPDPEEVAATARGVGPAEVLGTEHEVWPVTVDTAVLAAARLLAGSGGVHRGVVHAVATALSREVGLSEGRAHVVGRLALVHDLRRLAVDGRLPLDLCSEPLLASLAGRGLRVPPEVRLVRISVEVADALPAMDAKPDAASLAAVLRRVACGRGAVRSGLGSALERLAARPPDVVPVGELVDDLDRRRMGRRGMEERLRSLVGITRVLASSRDTRELMRVALEEVRLIVGAASASLERWERESGQLRCLVNVGQLGPGEEPFPENETYALSEYAQPRRTMLSGLPYMHTVDDAHADPEAIALLRSLEKYSSAAVPVYLEGRMWGQIWLTSDYGEPPFGAADIELLTAVATLMGGVVVQAENLDRVARLAFEDPLTRVGNRRAIDDALDGLAASGRDAALVLLDVDLLKQINDQRGHAHGDQALIRLADALSGEIATWPGGTVGRLGGDEFCVVLPGCARDPARLRVLRALSRLAVGHDPVAVSMGVAESAEVTDAGGRWTPRGLLAAADADLYNAKAAARVDRTDPP